MKGKAFKTVREGRGNFVCVDLGKGVRVILLYYLCCLVCSGCVVEFHTAAICGATASGLWLLSLRIFWGVSILQALDW